MTRMASNPDTAQVAVLADSMVTMSEELTPSEPLYAAMAAGNVRYQPWLGLPISTDQCFVCASTLDETNRSAEDVFPRWLQDDLRALPDRSRRPLQLPNLTDIALGSVLVPACRDCNGIHLSQLEGRISRAFRGGESEVRRLSEGDLRKWFAKIAYGSRLNDTRLDFDRRDPQSEKLATADDMRGMNNLHWLLQEVRDVVRVSPGHSKFWVFGTQVVNCASCDWDFATPVGWPNVAMFKHRGTVVLGAVDDRGALGHLREHPAFVAAGQLSLHKVQVRALHAIIVATAASLNSADFPLLYGVGDGRVWIERADSAVGAVNYERETRAVADAVLASLISEPLGAIERMGGAAGFLVLPSGRPREMPVSC
jgi:hypothetical protein